MDRARNVLHVSRRALRHAPRTRRCLAGRPRLSISTLRSLHTRDLAEYHPFARPSSAQRVALSPLGRLVLADRLGNPTGPALGTRPAATASKTTAPVR
ncbi:hypothetical protein [Streptomyces sp. C10-9-1]|uniref:hypothetical protein n=1 Tax=Streptomyces sp. C10-9-1 TaxID=1859285 RepID=UPI003F49C506